MLSDAWNTLSSELRHSSVSGLFQMFTSFVFTVVFCTLSFINLIRVAYVVRRPCSDFTDMLRRHINCRIIIIHSRLFCSVRRLGFLVVMGTCVTIFDNCTFLSVSLITIIIIITIIEE